MRFVLVTLALAAAHARGMRPQLPRLDSLLERSFDIVGLTESGLTDRQGQLAERAPAAGTYSAVVSPALPSKTHLKLVQIAIGASYSGELP